MGIKINNGIVRICSGYNKPKGLTGKLHSASYREHYKCTCKASIFENNKWWCKNHAPSKIKEREEKKWETYISKIRKNVERNS